jgi:hemoglobin
MTLQQSSNLDLTKQTLYDLVGGEDGVKNLVNIFYDIVETNPDAHKLHLLHLRGNGIAHSRLEQFNFLSGFLGGPKLYVEMHGHSNIRTMHAHVEVNAESKDIWLKCMSMALESIEMEVTAKEKLFNNFKVSAERLVNTPE